ncbi:MAG: DUF2937 family protein [Gallionella sp.]|nr:DUF2937 family protein [Gallionella sp.]
MSILYRYLMIIVACVSLLIGVQIPSFVDQYQKRVDAHLREVTINLQPFQEIANTYFGGNLDKLIELNLRANAKPLQEQGAAIALMVKRKSRFEADMAALQTSLPMKALHVLFNGDREMIDEALGQYSYTVPLNQDALLFGAAVSLLILLILELLFALSRFVGAKAWRRLHRPPLSKAL